MTSDRIELLQTIESLRRELNFYKRIAKVLVKYASEEAMERAKAEGDQFLIDSYQFESEVEGIIREHTQIIN